MSNANVVKKLDQLAPNPAVGECLRDLFLYELRNLDKTSLQYKEQYRTVLARYATPSVPGEQVTD
jgi:hypothetical protein